MKRAWPSILLFLGFTLVIGVAVPLRADKDGGNGNGNGNKGKKADPTGSYTATAERMVQQQLIAEQYRGVRPAPGYPACPEHSVKRRLFEVLDARQIGMEITENFAMMPASSVSGFYIAHPQARYFNVGPIGRDQLEDLARRRAVTASELERWLAPNLA